MDGRAGGDKGRRGSSGSEVGVSAGVPGGTISSEDVGVDEPLASESPDPELWSRRPLRFL
jgi:hypothetical protein